MHTLRLPRSRIRRIRILGVFERSCLWGGGRYLRDVMAEVMGQLLVRGIERGDRGGGDLPTGPA